MKQMIQVLYVVFVACLLLTPILYALYWLCPSMTWIHAGWDFAGMEGIAVPPVATLSLAVRIAGLMVSLVPMAAMLLTWYFLVRLFSAYRRNMIFTPSNARYIRNIGLVQLSWQLLFIPYQILLTFVMTVLQPEGQRFIAVHYSNHNLSMLLAALTIMVVGWTMSKAAVLQQEQALTV